jgi:hypothetical protein
VLGNEIPLNTLELLQLSGADEPQLDEGLSEIRTGSLGVTLQRLGELVLLQEFELKGESSDQGRGFLVICHAVGVHRLFGPLF